LKIIQFYQTPKEMTINTLLIDDEIDATEILERDLSRYFPFINVMKSCHTPMQAINTIRQTKPDLVFLDVEMAGMSGFDLLEVIDKPDFDIIITTAHSHYALNAYRANAIDFLLKPYDPEYLKQAVKKVIAHNPKWADNTPQSYVLHQKKTLKITHSDGFDIVKIEDIIYCEADGNITKFLLSTGRRLASSKNLGFFEEILAEFHFCRVHASFLVNLNFLEKYISHDRVILLKSNVSVPIAQQRLSSFLTALGKFSY
jgi:two-component system, LytTR family, response regulator